MTRKSRSPGSTRKTRSDSPRFSPTLPPLHATEDRGYLASRQTGGLQVPVGLLDMPYQQEQAPLMVDLSGSAGHGAVVGGPQSGKSTMLRTLIASLALTHTPQEVQFYCIDLGGGSMAALRDLPHVGGFASRREPDTVRRTIAELRGLLSEREQRFRAMGIESMADSAPANAPGGSTIRTETRS